MNEKEYQNKIEEERGSPPDYPKLDEIGYYNKSIRPEAGYMTGMQGLQVGDDFSITTLGRSLGGLIAEKRRYLPLSSYVTETTTTTATTTSTTTTSTTSTTTTTGTTTTETTTTETTTTSTTSTTSTTTTSTTTTSTTSTTTTTGTTTTGTTTTGTTTWPPGQKCCVWWWAEDLDTHQWKYFGTYSCSSSGADLYGGVAYCGDGWIYWKDEEYDQWQARYTSSQSCESAGEDCGGDAPTPPGPPPE